MQRVTHWWTTWWGARLDRRGGKRPPDELLCTRLSHLKFHCLCWWHSSNNCSSCCSIWGKCEWAGRGRRGRSGGRTHEKSTIMAEKGCWRCRKWVLPILLRANAGGTWGRPRGKAKWRRICLVSGDGCCCCCCCSWCCCCCLSMLPFQACCNEKQTFLTHTRLAAYTLGYFAATAAPPAPPGAAVAVTVLQKCKTQQALTGRIRN